MSNKKLCSRCTKERNVIEFYKSYSPIDTDGKVRVCKTCIKDMVDINKIESVHNLLRMLDKPFMHHLWKSALNKPNAVMGEYFKLINAKDYRHMTWENSVFNDSYTTETSNGDNDKVEVKTSYKNVTIDDDELGELQEAFGYGYKPEEYKLFQKKFDKLKDSFQLPTPMHVESLREYCVNKVKEGMAKAKGEFKEASEWAKMAKESAQGGKLLPSQMGDLSDGLEGFGQLSRLVEEHKDVLEILPIFRKQPKDDVDVTLWLYINYIRDIKALPEVQYEDIYKFYDERVKEYNSVRLDNDRLKSDGDLDE